MSETEFAPIPTSEDRVAAFLQARKKRKSDDEDTAATAAPSSTRLTKRARQSAGARQQLERASSGATAETVLQALITSIDSEIGSKARSLQFWTTARWSLDDFLRNLVLILETKTLMSDAKAYRDYLLHIFELCERALNSRLLPWVSARNEVSNEMIERVVQPFVVALGVGISFALQDYDNLADNRRHEYLDYLFHNLLESDLNSVPEQVALLPARLYDASNSQKPSMPSCEYLNKSSCTAPCRYDNRLQTCMPAQKDVPQCASVSLEAAQNIADMRKRLVTVFSGLLDFSDRMLRDLRLRAAAQTRARIPEQISQILNRSLSFSWMKAAMIGVASFGYQAARFVPLELLFDRATAQTIRGAALLSGAIGAAYGTTIATAAGAKHAGLLRQAFTEPACTLPFVRPTELALTEEQRREMLTRAQRAARRKVEPKVRSRIRKRIRAAKDDESESIAASVQKRIAQAVEDTQSK